MKIAILLLASLPVWGQAILMQAVVSGGSSNPFTFVSGCAVSNNGGSGSTGAVNCTGANFFIIETVSFCSVSNWSLASIGDSQSNTYTLGPTTSAGTYNSAIWYVYGGSASASQSFTYFYGSSGGCIQSISAMGFTRSAGGTQALDQSSHQLLTFWQSFSARLHHA